MSLKKLSIDAKKEQCALVRTIGDRLREARELNNMSQHTASNKLGYVNSSKLSKIENATDTNSVPLWLLLRASKLYEVSLDFLFGLSDDWEKSARMTIERPVGLWMNEAWEKMRRRDLAVLHSFYARQEALDKTVSIQTTLSLELEAAFDSFKNLNPSFDDMRGGNKLAVTIAKIRNSAQIADVSLKKFKRECAVASANTDLQLELFAEHDLKKAKKTASSTL